MIHYHGTPLGGTRDGVTRFARGRHLLIPFARQEDLATVADVASSFIFDNSAYTTWKQGKTFSWGGYVEWCYAWCLHPGLDWVLIPDVIDGSEEENDGLIERWRREVKGIPSVPVWHFGESLVRLAKLCDAWPRIALGSSGQYRTPGTERWWHRMGEIMSTVCLPDGRPKVRLHGLRMLSPAIVDRVPFASADSANAAINSGSVARFGMYCPPSSWQRAEAIAARIEAVNSPTVWTGTDVQMDLLTYVKREN